MPTVNDPFRVAEYAVVNPGRRSLRSLALGCENDPVGVEYTLAAKAIRGGGRRTQPGSPYVPRNVSGGACRATGTPRLIFFT